LDSGLYRKNQEEDTTMQSRILRLISLGVGLSAAGLTGTALAPWVLSAPQQPDPQADNTKANKPDRGKDAVTADQQKENAADRELARKIRRAIVQDTSLSTTAHNVKVIVRDGQVTLRGPVRSEEEKASIGSKAAGVAGADKVQNELTIKS
jgi:hyperosmotically inducible periplasmic protein